MATGPLVGRIILSIEYEAELHIAPGFVMTDMRFLSSKQNCRIDPPIEGGLSILWITDKRDRGRPGERWADTPEGARSLPREMIGMKVR